MSTLSITNIIKLTNYKLQTTKNKFKINRKFEALNFKGLNNFNEFSLQWKKYICECEPFTWGCTTTKSV